MNLTVGQKVKLKTLNALKLEFGLDESGHVDIPYGLNVNMKRYFGTTVTIKEVIDGGTRWSRFRIEECSSAYVFATECIDKGASKNTKNEGEMSMFGLDFGKVKKGEFKLSQYGLAVEKGNGKYVSYDKENKCLMDVSLLNFDASKFMFRMPVAMDSVQIGDVLIIDGEVVAVHLVQADGHLKVMNYKTATIQEVVPTKNMFGFNYYTKLVNFMADSLQGSASDKNPFGAMLPMMMMGDDIDPMVFMMMQQGGGALDMSNPMMMMALMGDKSKSDSKDMMLMMMLMNQAKTQTPVAPSQGE